jgi:hypothetical protein
MADMNKVFTELSRSKFRSRFRLGLKERRYLRDKDVSTITAHARRFVEQRLAPAEPKNDGKQTPFKGHPVFTAQHATATCCRGCLEKWHGIKKGRALSDEQIEYIVAVIRSWIEAQTADRNSG